MIHVHMEFKGLHTGIDIPGRSQLFKFRGTRWKIANIGFLGPVIGLFYGKP